MSKVAKKEVAVKTEIPVNKTEGFKLAEFMDSDFARNLGYEKAAKYWKANGAKTKNTGFRATFYDELRKGNFADLAKMLEFANANGASVNDIKQFSHFSAIADLVSDVRKSK